VVSILAEQEGKLYEIVYFDLSVPRNNYLLFKKGVFLLSYEITGSVKVRLNDPSADEIDLGKVKMITAPFDKLYFSNDAQPGKYAKVLIGIVAKFSVSGEEQKIYYWDGSVWKEWTSGNLTAPQVSLKDRECVDYTICENVSLASGNVLTHTGIDISSYSGITILVSSSGDVNVYPQISDDNTNWYDVKSVADGDRVYNCNAEKIAVPMNLYAHYFRIVIYANTDSTVTAKVIAQV